MPGLLLNAANMTTEKLLPMVEATTTAIPISKTTTTIITNLSAGSHGQNKRPTIIIYPTGKYRMYATRLCVFILSFPVSDFLFVHFSFPFFFQLLFEIYFQKKG